MRSLNRRRGVVNIWVILVLFLMVGLVGWACDLGWSALVLNQLQAAADASALAGAAKVKTDQTEARIRAQNLAVANRAANTPLRINLNDANAAGGDIVLGIYDKQNNTFTPDIVSPNAVQVVANRTTSSIDGAVNLVFGPIFGASTVELSASAIAIAQGASGAAVIVLHPTDGCALNLQGNPTINVTGGAIQVNSSAPQAACNQGSVAVTAPELNVVGGTNISLQGGTVNTGVSPIPDPLASLAAPANGTIQPKPPKTGNAGTIHQGYYPTGIERTNGDMIMAPGIYVIENGFSSTGGNLTGNGIMIYMKSGGLNLRGNGSATLKPQTTGPYAGVLYFQARDNLSDSQINGNNNFLLEGTIYIPGNGDPSTTHPNLDLRGTAASLGNQIIVWHMTMGGNSTINVPYTGAFPPGNSVVYLVK